MLAQLMYKLELFKLFERMKFIVYMNIYSTYLKKLTKEIKKMSNICDFDRISKTECNLQHFTRNCRIKNLDDSERDEAGAYLRRAGLLNKKEKGMTICCIISRCFVMFLRGGKVNVLEY